MLRDIIVKMALFPRFAKLTSPNRFSAFGGKKFPNIAHQVSASLCRSFAINTLNL